MDKDLIPIPKLDVYALARRYYDTYRDRLQECLNEKDSFVIAHKLLNNAVRNYSNSIRIGAMAEGNRPSDSLLSIPMESLFRQAFDHVRFLHLRSKDDLKR